jgi:hypothetical protein
MVNGPLWTAEYDPERPQRSNDRSARKHYRRTSPRRRCRFRWPTSDRVRRHEIPAARSGSAGELEEIKRRFKGQPNKIASHARSCWRYKLSFFGIERVVDRALGCGHRRVSAVRCTRVFLSFGLDRHFQKPRLMPWMIRYSTPRCSMFGLRPKGPSDPLALTTLVIGPSVC